MVVVTFIVVEDIKILKMTRTHLPHPPKKKKNRKKIEVGDGFVLLGNFFPSIN